MKRMIDPPGGWRYDFPKVLPNKVKTEEQLIAFLRKHKYPEADIPLALVASRYWRV